MVVAVAAEAVVVVAMTDRRKKKTTMTTTTIMTTTTMPTMGKNLRYQLDLSIETTLRCIKSQPHQRAVFNKDSTGQLNLCERLLL